MTAAAFVLPLLLLTAQDKKPVVPVAPMPAGAVRIDDQTYKVKEKDGKTWVYRRTAFGMSRVEETQFIKQVEAAPLKPVNEARVKVVDLGAEYRFERAHAFGVQVWKKKKSELSDDEKSYIENSKVTSVQAKPEAKAGEKKN